MPTIICQKCAKEFSLNAFTYWDYSGDVRCTNCGALHTIILTKGQLIITPILKEIDIIIIPNLPKIINEDLKEAQICNAVKLNKSSVVMCRRVLEQICDDKGAEGTTLRDKIKNLSSKGFISTEILEIFNEIRFFGNYGAHPISDQLSNVTEQDASEVLEITLHVTKHLYEIPDKVKKLRNKREKLMY